MDDEIGRVFAALDANDLTDSTVVIFTSDNGGERFADTWPFAGKKTELLEGGLRKLAPRNAQSSAGGALVAVQGQTSR